MTRLEVVRVSPRTVAWVATLLGLLLAACASADGVRRDEAGIAQVPTETLGIATGRLGFAAVAIGDYVYVLGGFEASGDNSPIAQVDVYSHNATYLGSLPEPMPTPRGFLSAIVFNETQIVTLGGSVSLADLSALPTVETLHISESSPLDGTWMSWPDLAAPRVNATVTAFFPVVIVGLGMSNVVEWANLGDLSVGLLNISDSDFDPSCEGTLAPLDEELYLLQCVGVDAVSYLVNITSSTYEVVQNTSLTPWNARSITQLTYDENFLFQAVNFAGASLIFELGQGPNITFGLCLAWTSCPTGVLVYHPSNFVCLTTFPTKSTPFLGAQWAVEGGDSQRTRQSKGTSHCYPPFTLFQSPQTLWRSPTPGRAVLSPSIGFDGSVLLSLFNDTHGSYGVYSYDGDSGYLQWAEINIATSSVLIGADGTVYLNDGLQHFISAFNGTNGELVWNSTSVLTSAEMVIGVNDTLITPDHLGGISSIGEDKGELIWTQPSVLWLESAALPSLVGDDGTVYVGLQSEAVQALNGADGTTLWETSAPSTVVPVAIGLDGTVYASDNKKVMLGLNTAGQIIMSSSGLFSPCVGPTLVYFISTINGQLQVLAMDPSTQEDAWVWSPPSGWGNVLGQAYLALGRDGTLFVQVAQWASEHEQGSEILLAAIDGETGASKWISPQSLPWSPGAPAKTVPLSVGPNGWLYVPILSNGTASLVAVGNPGSDSTSSRTETAFLRQ